MSDNGSKVRQLRSDLAEARLLIEQVVVAFDTFAHRLNELDDAVLELDWQQALRHRQPVEGVPIRAGDLPRQCQVKVWGDWWTFLGFDDGVMLLTDEVAHRATYEPSEGETFQWADLF